MVAHSFHGCFNVHLHFRVFTHQLWTANFNKLSPWSCWSVASCRYVAEPVTRAFRHMLHWRKNGKRGISSDCLCSWLASRTGVYWRITRWILPSVTGAISDFENRGSLGKVGLDRPEGVGDGRACLCHYLHRATLLFSRQFFFCFPQPFAQSSPAIFRLVRWRVWYFRPFVLSSILDFFCFDHEQKKSKSLKRPRPVAGSINVLSFACSTLWRHIAIICASILFRSIFFFCFPRYLLLSLLRSPFVSRGGPFVVLARFLLSSNLEFFCCNPEQNKRKSLKLPCPVRASYCLANVFYCFQARSSEFA